MMKRETKRNPRRHNGRANARKNFERYTALAQVAAQSGDVIASENYYQHAEHFLRVMKGQ